MEQAARTSDFMSLGDQMKVLESLNVGLDLNQNLFTVIRVDGQAFSSFTRGFVKPFDETIRLSMVAAARALMKVFQTPVAYQQSDEITVVIPPRPLPSGLPFKGRRDKLVSTASAAATGAFIMEGLKHFPDVIEKRMPRFDARVFSVPNKETAAAAIRWRMMDAERNALSMVAQSHFTSVELEGVDRLGMLKMLAEAGIDFEGSYAAFHRLGTFLHKSKLTFNPDDSRFLSVPEAYRPTEPTFRTVVSECSLHGWRRYGNLDEAILAGEMPIMQAV